MRYLACAGFLAAAAAMGVVQSAGQSSSLADHRRSVFQSWDLSASRFNTCRLDQAVFHGCRLADAVFEQCSLGGTKLKSCELAARLQACRGTLHVSASQFSQARLSATVLRNVQGDDLCIRSARLRRLQASDMALERPSISGLRLSSASIRDIRLERCSIYVGLGGLGA